MAVTTKIWVARTLILVCDEDGFGGQRVFVNASLKGRRFFGAPGMKRDLEVKVLCKDRSQGISSEA